MLFNATNFSFSVRKYKYILQVKNIGSFNIKFNTTEPILSIDKNKKQIFLELEDQIDLSAFELLIQNEKENKYFFDDISIDKQRIDDAISVAKWFPKLCFFSEISSIFNKKLIAYQNIKTVLLYNELGGFNIDDMLLNTVNKSLNKCPTCGNNITIIHNND
jgi:hypothetical protein